MDGYGARLPLHDFAFTGQFVEPFTPLPHRRVHGRNLGDRSAITGEHGLQILHTRLVYGTFRNQFTLRIRGGRLLSQAATHPVMLVGVQQEGRHLGGLSQADGQQTGGQRIQTARVTRLAGLEQALDLLQSGVGGDGRRFVQQQYAVDVAEPASRHGWETRDG